MAQLDVYAGPIFAGKSRELIRRLEVLEVAGKKILVIKPKVDDRTEMEIAARGRKEKSAFPAYSIEGEDELSALLSGTPCDVLAVDETQFFGDWLINFIKNLLDENKNEDFLIIVAGLELDAWRKEFGPVGKLMLEADNVYKLKAVCNKCRGMPENAIFTQKTGGTPGKIIEVGDKIYEATCRCCWTLPIE